MTELGVSIIICCFNGARRLPATLNNLKQQIVPPHIHWEVIVIDNASTDQTAQVAMDFWNGFSGAQLRVVSEPKIGKSNALRRGFQETQYEFMSIVDDDNWVASNWVETVYKIMMAHPNVGACGGSSEAVFEVEPPEWFEKYQGWFAVGQQGTEYGDITWKRGCIWGAGMTVRKTAWKFLVDNDFHPFLSALRGTSLASGEDNELGLAMRLAGWKLWLDESLMLQHYMPAGRLRWDYLKKLMRANGAMTVGLIPYQLALYKGINILKGRTGTIWIGNLRKRIKRLIQLELRRFFFQKKPIEGDNEILELEELRGSIGEFIKKRGQFDLHVYSVRDAKWNIIGPQQIKR